MKEMLLTGCMLIVVASAVLYCGCSPDVQENATTRKTGQKRFSHELQMVLNGRYEPVSALCTGMREAILAESDLGVKRLMAREFAAAVIAQDIETADVKDRVSIADNFFSVFQFAYDAMLEADAPEKERVDFLVRAFDKYKKACCIPSAPDVAQSKPDERRIVQYKRILMSDYESKMCFARNVLLPTYKRRLSAAAQAYLEKHLSGHE